MEARKEQALVGLFVVIATGLLLATVFALSGVMGRAQDTYRTRFRNAAGVQPGAKVTFAGVKVGRVEAMRIDPQREGEIEFTLRVQPGTPIKTDSLVKIISESPLGENVVNIEPGSKDKPLEKDDDGWLPSKEFFGLPQLAERLEGAAPKMEEALDQINDRLAELKVTIERANDLINDQNRARISSALNNISGMLEENRPKVRSTLSNVEASSKKVEPLLDDLKKTIDDTRKAINNADAMLTENRPAVKDALQKLDTALDKASSVLAQLDRTMNYNAENIDEILENIRMTTEYLKQFTDTIKSHPSTLIRSPGRPDRKPGQAPPKD
jgi:phospholipid/cholesterol/gamma-HCH transport system substrate-binding protein